MPSWSTGLSHICADGCAPHPGSTHPALAGGAVAVSPAVTRAAPRAAVMYRFVILILYRRGTRRYGGLGPRSHVNVGCRQEVVLAGRATRCGRPQWRFIVRASGWMCTRVLWWHVGWTDRPARCSSVG